MNIKKEAERKRKELNANEDITISDLLFYIISRLDDQQKRLSVVETKQKILFYSLPIVISIVGIIVKIA